MKISISANGIVHPSIHGRAYCPFSPWQTGFRERFHGRFRDAFLSQTVFGRVAEARVLCEALRQEVNEERPHPSLGYLTPAEYKPQGLQQQSENPETNESAGLK